MSFWEERKALEDGLKDQGDIGEREEISFEFMENEPSPYEDGNGHAINAYDFLHGYCDVFAAVLAGRRMPGPSVQYKNRKERTGTP